MNSLKENILKNAHITKAQMERALSIQKKKGISLRRVLVEEKIISESALADLFSGRFYMPTLCLDRFKFDPGIIDLFPEHIARLYNAVPLFKTADTLMISTAEPLNIFVLDDLISFCRCNIVLVLSPENEIVWAIDSLYSKDGLKDAHEKIGLADTSEDRQEPVEKLVDIVLAHALKRRASDIHIEPEPDCLRIRYRVDGFLQDVLKVPKINQNSVLTRLKVISDFDITESRIPQDGKFKVKSGAQEVEFRVSSLPTTFGQKFVLHALDKSMLGVSLDRLGFSDGDTAIVKSAVARPSGLILFSGPVGSGKTTTLYSVLNHLNTASRHIITIEDPVEYLIGGITQVQARPDAGLDFSSALGSILRQSPDVVMIDQIRDSGVADVAVKAALSGQLVLSTVQSEDAISGILRLIEMGVEPFLVASSLIMLCSQRLARRLCPKCRKSAEIPKDFLEKSGFSAKAKFSTSEGCDYCNHTGFFGRVAISETVLIDEAIRDIIIGRKPADEIRKYALKHSGFKSMRDHAYLKVKDGLISLDEAIRISTEE